MAKRFFKRQYYLIKLRYRRYKDKKATNKTKITYMPVKELETVGLKYADNLEELENEIFNDQFSDNIEIIDLQQELPTHPTQSVVNVNLESTESISDDDAKTFLTAKEIPLNL